MAIFGLHFFLFWFVLDFRTTNPSWSVSGQGRNKMKRLEFLCPYCNTYIATSAMSLVLKALGSFLKNRNYLHNFWLQPLDLETKLS